MHRACRVLVWFEDGASGLISLYLSLSSWEKEETETNQVCLYHVQMDGSTANSVATIILLSGWTSQGYSHVTLSVAGILL